MKKLISRFIHEESGQGLVEYIILAALMIIVLITVIRNLGGTMGEKFKEIEKNIR